MSTRETHAISKSLDVKFWPDGGGDFQLRAPGFVADLTPEQATQLRHHLTVWLEAGAPVGHAVSNPVHLLTSQQPTPPSWSSTPPTEPGWYWLDVPTMKGLRIVQVEREGEWWTVTGPKVAASWRLNAGQASEWGWKWWSEHLSPPSVPHG